MTKTITELNGITMKLDANDGLQVDKITTESIVHKTLGSGTAGQVLSSTGNGWEWGDVPGTTLTPTFTNVSLDDGTQTQSLTANMIAEHDTIKNWYSQNTKIMFHGVFNKTSQNCFVSFPTVCYANNFSNRFPPVGRGWDPVLGRFTAPRDCYMNFCWQCMLFSNVGSGSNLMNAQITHFNSDGTVKESVVSQFIPSYNDTSPTPANQLQATPCVTAVVYMLANEYVQVGASSDSHFKIYSLGVNTQVSFSGHNCD